MTFIQDYRDLRKIALGFRKAQRDIARIKQHIVMHNVLHETDETGEWECHEFNTKFFSSLGRDIEHDTLEAVGYNRGREKYQARIIKEAERSDAQNHGGPSTLTFIPIEMTGDESQEEILARVHRAISEHDIFLEQVSETNQQNPDSPTTDQKESK